MVWKPRRLIHRPTKRAIQAGIAAQAPPDWVPPVREKKRKKLVEDEMPDLGKLPDDSD